MISAKIAQYQLERIAWGYRLLVQGNSAYKRVLQEAFPRLYVRGPFPPPEEGFSWCSYITGPVQLDQLQDFLELLSEHLLLIDDLEQCYALDYHTIPNQGRSPLAELVYEAKTYSVHHPGSRKVADKLVEMMAALVERHPVLREAQVLIPVPGSQVEVDFHLPRYLVERLAHRLKMTDGNNFVAKTRATDKQKDKATLLEKIENIREAFMIYRRLEGQRVLLVDDVYRSGITLGELAWTARRAGAKHVWGLVLTKTLGNAD